MIGERQQKILNYIQDFLAKNGYPPSVREIGKAVGLSSTASVARHLKALEKEGYISHPPAKRRAWTMGTGHNTRSISLPLVGNITAGVPILATEVIEEHLNFPASLFRVHPDFLLRVVGDSMIGAGIFDGDLVAVQSTSAAHDGDIVIALLGDEATVKYFYKDSHGIRLMPANERYQPIISSDVQILGKVVGLIRSL
ncbi:transcriptional repressor LexA [Sulfobacillus thermosulfidooxidans]|uniref:transcriptional repressor LexA n=1 Tax=Sulfobacillus thermosulfidooxidans TaxID=28034 RepID=UPI00096B7D03|nr:transcriptional repressor LexA [Sulfobacillus thermosulfidooxidans]OLZ09538.1 repressor LexA [Sulfobacillus thermosulfidooxidans]OLZ16156.1 repressor LexA [Sulfobacillus thermosulfidooxidans]OLZ17996.1 repressor LexA [Sulfobacillus thermosulfidooxidans]